MTVLNKRNSGIPAGSVYIGRGSIWGNTFSHLVGVANTTHVKDRDEACDRHYDKLNVDIYEGRVTLNQLASLHGKDLVCFCAPLRCHGDTLAVAAAWAVEQLANGNPEGYL